MQEAASSLISPRNIVDELGEQFGAHSLPYAVPSVWQEIVANIGYQQCQG